MLYFLQCLCFCYLDFDLIKVERLHFHSCTVLGQANWLLSSSCGGSTPWGAPVPYGLRLGSLFRTLCNEEKWHLQIPYVYLFLSKGSSPIWLGQMLWINIMLETISRTKIPWRDWINTEECELFTACPPMWPCASGLQPPHRLPCPQGNLRPHWLCLAVLPPTACCIPKCHFSGPSSAFPFNISFWIFI